MFLLVSYALKQLKKRLHGLTKEHEALFNYLENNKHISTEKEKQKVQNTVCKLLLYHLGSKKNNIFLKSYQYICWKLKLHVFSQQMCNRLTKSAEQQSIVDEHYYSVNMEGHQMRLKLQNTLKNCCQVGKHY